MANKLSTVLDNLETVFNAMVTAGTIKAFKREILIPAMQHNTPILGMVVSHVHRDKPIWICHVSLPLVARAGEDAADEVVLNLIGDVTEKIETLIDAGTAGGHINQPRWEFWQIPVGKNLRKVGAIGALSITVNDPLKTA